MLTGLQIRDFVLVRALDLELAEGFTAITGETGAGKSVLLAALVFVLGGRGGQGLVRPGAKMAEACASFEVADDHPVRALLTESGLEAGPGEALVLRRTVTRGGGARGFINDRAVSARLMAQAGELLADIHGQHAGLGLLDARRHRAMLDAWAASGPLLVETGAAWVALRAAEAAQSALAARLETAAAERGWLAHALAELDELDPLEGECARLALERASLQANERVAEGLEMARHSLHKAGIETALAQAARSVSRALAAPALQAEAGDLAARVRQAAEALDRAIIETAEARTAIEAAASACDWSPAALEASEARLFALRAAARKHKLAADALPELASTLAERLARLDAGAERLAAARQAVDAARAVFAQAARALSSKRQAAAARLDAAVLAELAPLKLEAARFHTALMALEEAQWHAQGADRAEFTVSTNPGAPFGGLTRIASGGELSRFILALKVALAGEGSATTLIFDEIDRGVGGAVAQAIGDRLARLGGSAQVLVVTHSPQVAARGDAQWRIEKGDSGEGVRTRVVLLGAEERREEIARMLSGETITAEARAQGARLLERLE